MIKKMEKRKDQVEQSKHKIFSNKGAYISNTVCF